MKLYKKYAPYVGIAIDYLDNTMSWISWQKLKEMVAGHNNRIANDELDGYQRAYLYYQTPIRLSEWCKLKNNEQHFIGFLYCPVTGKKIEWDELMKDAIEFDKQWFFRSGKLYFNKRARYNTKNNKYENKRASETV